MQVSPRKEPSQPTLEESAHSQTSHAPPIISIGGAAFVTVPPGHQAVAAEPHQIVPEIGAVSLFLREKGDVQRASELLRLSYELAVRQKTRRRPVIQP